MVIRRSDVLFAIWVQLFFQYWYFILRGNPEKTKREVNSYLHVIAENYRKLDSSNSEGTDSLFFVLFALFKLAGWPKRAPIARGSQWVPKDLAVLSLSPPAKDFKEACGCPCAQKTLHFFGARVHRYLFCFCLELIESYRISVPQKLAVKISYFLWIRTLTAMILWSLQAAPIT